DVCSSDLGDAKQAAGQRNQQQGTAGDPGGATGGDSRHHAEQQGGEEVDLNAQGVGGRQAQHADGDGGAGHVDGRAQRDGHRVSVLVQAEALADLQVDRNVGRRAAGEEGGDAAFAQHHEHQRVGIAANLPEHDGRVDHQSDEQHGADQHHQQVAVAVQRLKAGVAQGGGHQAEDAERREMDDDPDDEGHALGQVLEHRTGRFAAVANGQADAHGPGQDADVVGLQQGLYRVGAGAVEQRLEHFQDAAGRCDAGGGVAQRQGGGPQGAGDDAHHGGAQG